MTTVRDVRPPRAAPNLADMFQRGYMVPRPAAPPLAVDAAPRRARTAAAVHPNLGVEVAYRRKLLKLVDEMAASVSYWLSKAYARNEPRIAMDSLITAGEVATKRGSRWVGYVNGEPLVGAGGKPRLFMTQTAAENAALKSLGSPGVPAAKPKPKPKPSPAADLQKSFDELAARWQSRFDESASDLARYFAKANRFRTDAALRAALDKGGFRVELRMTPAARDILKATTQQNVELIRTIPQQYLSGVQGDVMRSIQAGRDLSTLSRALRTKYGVTRRRAAFIAKDQNNKATASIVRSRQNELGIKKAIWMHSGGGKEPRPKHVAADGREYDVTKGLPIGDKGQYVFPGEEINCRCVSRSVIPGFD